MFICVSHRRDKVFSIFKIDFFNLYRLILIDLYCLLLNLIFSLFIFLYNLFLIKASLKLKTSVFFLSIVVARGPFSRFHFIWTATTPLMECSPMTKYLTYFCDRIQYLWFFLHIKYATSFLLIWWYCIWLIVDHIVCSCS